MIKQCPKDKKLPRESNKEITVIRAEFEMDLTGFAFRMAWKAVCDQLGKKYFPKELICNVAYINMLSILQEILQGDVLIADTKDVDEWWITFIDLEGNDTNIMFYSQGV